MLKKWLVRMAVLMVCFLGIWGLTPDAIAAPSPDAVVLDAAAPNAAAPDAAALFETNCAGCHPQGGNIIRRGKSLKLKALEKNGLETEAAIASLITLGKNNMSAYGDKLSADEIAALSQYVWEQAQQGWTS